MQPALSMPVSSSISTHAPWPMARTPGIIISVTCTGRRQRPQLEVMSTVSPVSIPKRSASRLFMYRGWSKASRRFGTLANEEWEWRKICRL